MTKKVDFYGSIQEEVGVIMAFSKLHESLGFTKLVPSKNRGFDIESIEYNGKEVTIEFEFKSSNFISHKHPSKMIAGRNYVVVCWEDDCGLISRLKNEYEKDIDLIEMRNYVRIKEDFETPNLTISEKPKYVILSYNPSIAGGRDFGDWASSHCYRVNTSKDNPKFAKDRLPPWIKNSILSKRLHYRWLYSSKV